MGAYKPTRVTVDQNLGGIKYPRAHTTTTTPAAMMKKEVPCSPEAGRMLGTTLMPVMEIAVNYVMWDEYKRALMEGRFITKLSSQDLPLFNIVDDGVFGLLVVLTCGCMYPLPAGMMISLRRAMVGKSSFRASVKTGLMRVSNQASEADTFAD